MYTPIHWQTGPGSHMAWYVGKPVTLSTIFLIISAQMYKVAAISNPRMELSASISLKLLKDTICLWVVLISLTCNDYTATVIMGQSRWWLSLFIYLLDVGTSITLILFKESKEGKNKDMTLFEFKSKLVNSFVGTKIGRIDQAMKIHES
jgi:hypothetical protein